MREAALIRETTVGDRVREIRYERGLTHTELPERIGVGYPAISKIETGKVNPHRATITALALGVQPESLLGEPSGN